MIGPHAFKVVAFVELIARYLPRGESDSTRRSFPGKLTYHDPCQIARNGGVIEEPRYVHQPSHRYFVEITAQPRGKLVLRRGRGPRRHRREGVPDEVRKVKADQMRTRAHRPSHGVRELP